MKTIKLPETFVLQGADSKVAIATLAKLIEYRNKEIAIDFSQLKVIRKGDLMVLLAQLEKSITQGNKFYRKGKKPKNKSVRKILFSSIKLLHVNKKIDIKLGKLKESEKQNIIDITVIDSIVEGLKQIGIKDYYYPFNEFLTELIGNAVEHGINNKNINWWLTHEIVRKERAIKYTFVDMGLGIIGSHKKAGLPFKYYLQSSKYIILDALYAKLGSSTKKDNRGRGLPQLRDMIEKGYVTDLVIISNNVILHFENNKFVSTKTKCFAGTYFSWTINRNCIEKWKNLK